MKIFNHPRSENKHFFEVDLTLRILKRVRKEDGVSDKLIANNFSHLTDSGTHCVKSIRIHLD